MFVNRPAGLPFAVLVVIGLERVGVAGEEALMHLSCVVCGPAFALQRLWLMRGIHYGSNSQPFLVASGTRNCNCKKEE